MGANKVSGRKDRGVDADALVDAPCFSTDEVLCNREACVALIVDYASDLFWLTTGTACNVSWHYDTNNNVKIHYEPQGRAYIRDREPEQHVKKVKKLWLRVREQYPHILLGDRYEQFVLDKEPQPEDMTTDEFSRYFQRRLNNG